MHLTSREVQVRNLLVSVVNGIITFIILIIAPLGLFAVIINTALITVATYFTATVADWVMRYLKPQSVRAEMMGSGAPSTQMRRRQKSESDLSQHD